MAKSSFVVEVTFKFSIKTRENSILSLFCQIYVNINNFSVSKFLSLCKISEKNNEQIPRETSSRRKEKRISMNL